MNEPPNDSPTVSSNLTLVQLASMLDRLRCAESIPPGVLGDIQAAHRALSIAAREVDAVATMNQYAPFLDLSRTHKTLSNNLSRLSDHVQERALSPRETNFIAQTKAALDHLEGAMIAMKKAGRLDDAVVPLSETKPDTLPPLRMGFDITPEWWGRGCRGPHGFLKDAMALADALDMFYISPIEAGLQAFIGAISEIRFSVHRVSVECIDTKRSKLVNGPNLPDFTLGGDRAILVHKLNQLKTDTAGNVEILGFRFGCSPALTNPTK